jgi:hypothetical protein
MSVERSRERHRKLEYVYEIVLAHEQANKCEEKSHTKRDREWTRISSTNAREERTRTADKLWIYADKEGRPWKVKN